MAHEIAKKYTEKCPGGILPDSTVVVCTCGHFREKATDEARALERFEKHQRYPEKAMQYAV